MDGKFKQRNHLSILAATALVLVFGCVKEDRSGCPCLLAIDMSEAAQYRISSDIMLTVACPGIKNTRTIQRNSIADEYTYRVRKGDVLVLAIEGADKCDITDEKASAPEGTEFDSIFASCHIVQATGETCRDKVHLDKQFATLDVHVLEYGDIDNLAMSVNCPSSGFFTESLRPLDESYRCSFLKIDDNLFRVRVPRQSEGPIFLELSDGSGKNAAIEISGQILDSGYDWEKPSLDDMTVILDYMSCSVIIDICEWGNESDNDVII